jgi:uncharacterized protein (DUF2252 family)
MTKFFNGIGQLTTPQLSIDERIAIGKKIRQKIPRSTNAHYQTLSSRRDPVSIIMEQNQARIQELIPIRHARMLTSPFAFLRGTAKIMIEDIGKQATSKIPVLANGDMHVSNFGIYATAERNIVFSMNDFDETYPGAWEWDIKRLTTSAVVCAQFLGGDHVECEGAARAVVKAYRERMANYAKETYLSIWYKTIQMQEILATLSAEAQKETAAIVAKAQSRTQLQLFEKMAHLVNDHPQIMSTGSLLTRDANLESNHKTELLEEAILKSYIESLNYDRRNLLERYQVLDIARKVVGVGSVGTRCWVILLQGVNDNDPLFLQIKEAQHSVLEPFSHTTLPFPNQGRRVVFGQRTVQGAPDIFLGWGQLQDGLQFYVRQLSDMKGGIELSPGKTKLSLFKEYCNMCGWALALAHAKSGDPAILSGYCGSSDELDTSFAQFAFAYAKQNERDYEAMQQAANSGRIAVAKNY